MLARLTWHAAVQLEGRPVEVAPPTRDRLGAVQEHIERLVVETAVVGVPEAPARGLVGTDLMTVTIEVAERLDDTPGTGHRKTAMSELADLESIRDCLRAGLPCPLATCLPDGVPHTATSHRCSTSTGSASRHRASS